MTRGKLTSLLAEEVTVQATWINHLVGAVRVHLEACDLPARARRCRVRGRGCHRGVLARTGLDEVGKMRERSRVRREGHVVDDRLRGSPWAVRVSTADPVTVSLSGPAWGRWAQRPCRQAPTSCRAQPIRLLSVSKPASPHTLLSSPDATGPLGGRLHDGIVRRSERCHEHDHAGKEDHPDDDRRGDEAAAGKGVSWLCAVVRHDRFPC